VLTSNVNAFATVAGGEAVSVTWAVKLNWPLALGVPEICPLVAASWSPVGN